tara:strand:+ start:181514 stop:183265 length:1752 start_codon:yes stop_codon:yes gene_type:complete
MKKLTDILSEKIGAAFAGLDLPQELGEVRFSDRPDLAQFQCNGAMAAAKQAGRAPRDIATDIIAKIDKGDLIETLDIAGPGFINISLTQNALQNYVNTEIAGLGAALPENGQTIVLDYGGPNVGKPMHVGHLRSAIIGDTLRRILSFAGYKTLGDVHMGDWGTQMGMILMELKHQYPDWPYFDADFTGPYPEESPLSINDFEQIYPKASKACKEDEARAEEARAATVELQNKRAGYYALWQHFMDVSIAAMKENYAALNVYFDLWKGESDVHDLIEPMVAQLKKDGHAVKDEGALVIKVARNDDTKKFPPLILYKKDGAVMYGTTDMATLVERMNLYAPDKVVYIVDQRQHLHFEQVFRAAKQSNIVPQKVELTHAGFGTMNGTDGKPFKTREGGVMKLEDLIDMAFQKASAKIDAVNPESDFSDEEKNAIANAVGIAAIKFADLQNPRQTDYVFDLDKLVSFEGKTGPYILYQIVRIKSMLRKAGGFQKTDFTVDDNTQNLALLLAQFPNVIDGVVQGYTPHILCDFVYKLAQEFGRFYAANPILVEKDEAKRNAYLSVCAILEDTLSKCMELMGIDIPERM